MHQQSALQTGVLIRGNNVTAAKGSWKSEGPGSRKVVDSTKSLPQRQEAGTIGSKTANDNSEVSKAVSIPNKPGWEGTATSELIPLVKALGGGLKTKSICTSLVKKGYARVMDMINKPAVLKEAYQEAKGGPANAQLLSRIGQGRVRVPPPNNNMGNYGRNNSRNNNNNRNNQGNRGHGGRNSMPQVSGVVGTCLLRRWVHGPQRPLMHLV